MKQPNHLEILFYGQRKKKHVVLQWRECLQQLQLILFCKNFISQKASGSKVATVTVTAATVMLNPICPLRLRQIERSGQGIHLILFLQTLIQGNQGQEMNWKSCIEVCVIPASSQFAIQFNCCEMPSFFMDKITGVVFSKSLSGAFPFYSTTQLLKERRLVYIPVGCVQKYLPLYLIFLLTSRSNLGFNFCLTCCCFIHGAKEKLGVTNVEFLKRHFGNFER